MTTPSRRFLVQAALAVAAAGIAAPSAGAQIVDVTQIGSSWGSVTGGSNVTINNGGSPITVRWGSQTSRSGYDFTNSPTPLQLDLTPGFALFNIGTFVHRNFTIPSGGGITGVELGIDLSFDDNPTVFSQFFNISHTETPNGENPCADGNPNGIGVNINGCADLVTFDGSGSGSSIDIGGVTYELSLEGFSSDPLNFNGTNQFWTVEGQVNSAFLFGRLAVANDVPEPTTLAMLSFVLIGIGVVARRRNRTS